ncbi:MAG: hypothetical protein JJT96_01015 [Opitutales bacterium]|nr:hypothetical protein [Opitutales bacterium]
MKDTPPLYPPAPSGEPPPAPSRWTRFFQSEIPITVYAAIALTMVGLWIFQEFNPDVTLGMFTELAGAAFTLFIIDTLLVRSKAKRWKIVRVHVDYLIGRNINRLRDGLGSRVFGFQPKFEERLSEKAQHQAISGQRGAFFSELEALPLERLSRKLVDHTLFTEDSYAYFNEKADDLWEILNMKYSEYMEPELVSILMQLHTHVKNVCGHIRQYAKAERYPADARYYRRIGRMGATASFHKIVQLVNQLKQLGYSQAATLADTPE